jgi:hypothetical protein
MNKTAMRIVCLLAAIGMLVGFFWILVYAI